MGLSVLGTVGLLVWGRRVDAFPALRPRLDALIVQGGFRLSREVYEAPLKAVGEAQ
ncbi:MAG: DUF3368 domain-containing protein [Verrucomicrobia bacterium]|nr:DUF3368 domain-containing protein [Verrucomicrobiota bacterium]